VTKKHSGLRATFAIILAGLACTSCGALSAFSTSTKPTVQPAPTEAAAPTRAAAPEASPSAVPAAAKAHKRELRQRLVTGVNSYCRDFYVMQKAANVRYPASADDHARALLLAAGSRRVLARLDALRAPSPLTRTELHGFARNERRLVGAFKEEASSNAGVVSAGGGAYNRVLAERHDFATELGAKECDGLLPSTQARAAAAATRRWDVTPSAQESCVSLVTPSFSISTWGLTADPLDTCLQEYSSRREAPQGPQRAIQVQSVTGVENLQATVTFTQVPDCGCGPLVAKLYFEHGRWLLNEVYEQ
jgi:hypothetical protein